MGRSRALALVAAAALAAALAGCVPSRAVDPLADGPNVLRVLAGSEVKDMLPLLEEARKATGVEVKLAYEGTIAGTEEVASGGASGVYDATWFPNNRYLSLLPGAGSAISTSTKIMTSPVVFAVTPAVASRLGWDAVAPSWAEIANAAASGEFSYGMTNPAASNSGFSALVSVATALSGTGSALTVDDIDAVLPQLARFAAGQKLTAGSSGWLAERYRENPDGVDAIVNYESVLMGLAASGVPLTIVTPRDGVVTSDYPLTLLASAAPEKRGLYEKLTAWLTSPEAQREIVDTVHRRPAVPGIDTGDAFPSGVLFETPFPNTLAVANSLIESYLGSARAPSRAVFVLDTSGSMAGERIAALRSALKDLAGADTSTVGGFAKFRGGERVSLLAFDSRTAPAVVVDIPKTDAAAAYREIADFADGLDTGGGTAIYSALQKAYQSAVEQKRAEPGTFVSVVLMSDGENTDGWGYADFERYYRGLGGRVDGIPCFVVLFGDGNVDEMRSLAALTGGQTFDALSGDLSRAFQEIRGYQ